MADHVIELAQSLPSTMRFRYRDMGDGTHALVYAIGGTVVATIAVPAPNSVANLLIQDVVGNKLDVASEAVGTASIVALIRQLLADVAGLEATIADIEDEVEEIDEHSHNIERWWGASQAPDETNAIAATVTSDFQAASGANTWGTAVPILGTADDPTPGGQSYFDPHRVLFTDLDDDTSLWRFRIIYGYGTSGAAITAGQWTEIETITNAVPGNRAGGTPVDVRMIVLPVGIKMWAQAWNDTDEEVLSFQWGCHAYPAPAAPTPP